MVINYKPLNKVLKWIRYPLPNKSELISRIYNATIFSKFDMKSGYYQIKVKEEDKYKTAFIVPFGQYEWNVMPMGLKNAPSEFQNIMNTILNPYSKFALVYIDDVLIFSESIEQHLKHLRIFKNLIKKNGMVVSQKKIKLAQTKIRFLGHDIYQGTITPIKRSIEFSEKFLDEIKDKTQLQRFLGCVNYVADFIPKIRILCKPLYNRLRKNPKPWTPELTKIVQDVKAQVKTLPCLGIPNPEAQLIVETDASNQGYGGILKQKVENHPEQIVKYHSGIWNPAQTKYSTIKKEILSIVLCMQKFQHDLINKTFLLRIDCKSAKEVLEKDVKNLVSKQIFARWQSLISCFDFEIEFIKGKNNSIPDFLTREFLQGSSHDHPDKENGLSAQPF
uniref:Enzymatic polyprotein n=1 Tax=Cajanus cajan TaxID=3821 RepID=A0A151UHI4_CAJCA